MAAFRIKRGCRTAAADGSGDAWAANARAHRRQCLFWKRISETAHANTLVPEVCSVARAKSSSMSSAIKEQEYRDDERMSATAKLRIYEKKDEAPEISNAVNERSLEIRSMETN